MLQRMVIFIFYVSFSGKLQAGFSGKKIAKCYNSQIHICKIEILQIYILGNMVSCKILAWIRPCCKIGNFYFEYLGKFVLERLSCIKESWHHGTILISILTSVFQITILLFQQKPCCINFSRCHVKSGATNKILLYHALDRSVKLLK